MLKKFFENFIWRRKEMPNLNHCMECDKPYNNPGIICLSCSQKYIDIREESIRLQYKNRKRIDKEKV